MGLEGGANHHNQVVSLCKNVSSPDAIKLNTIVQFNIIWTKFITNLYN